MDLRLFTLILEPVNPVQFSLTEIRAFIVKELDRFTALRKDHPPGVIHRYPAVQCKIVKNSLMLVGFSQGADLLEEISRDQKNLSPGKNACTIVNRDAAIRRETFEVTGTMVNYEFLTPWRGLNQQNTKKFYTLQGKPDRDLFMQKILMENLLALAKSLDYRVHEPITCDQKLRFRKDWIDSSSVMVFTGRFQTNLQIPDYLGMGQSVSLGFGTLRRIPDNPMKESGETVCDTS